MYWCVGCEFGYGGVIIVFVLCGVEVVVGVGDEGDLLVFGIYEVVYYCVCVVFVVDVEYVVVFVVYCVVE